MKRIIISSILIIVVIAVAIKVNYKVKGYEELWLEAVKNNNQEKAIEMANLIIVNSGKSLPIKNIKFCASMLERKQINKEYLFLNFNEWDFKLWKDALFFKEKSEAILDGLSDDNKKINAILETVNARIEPRENNKKEPLWPKGIWDRKYGVCDRQALLVSELAYQAGYETAIVWFRNPKTGVSPHTICEVRTKDNSKVWSIDSFYKTMLPKSLHNIDLNLDLKKEMWPKRIDYYDCLTQSEFMIPSYPQDCCPKNQLLYSCLSEKLKNKTPVFGVSPRERGNKYKRNLDTERGVNNKIKFGIYGYLFMTLNRELKLRRNK